MRTIAVVNQKGGCGKTTTTVNLGGALEALGKRVLVVDLDPQAHATLALGVSPEEIDRNLFDVLAERGRSARDVRVPVGATLDLLPSGIALSALEQKLAREEGSGPSARLAEALAPLDPEYDFALVDCPPNVGLLTFNALRAAAEVIIPLETSGFAIHGGQKLLETLALLADRIGNSASVRILPTLYDGRTRYARETLGEIRALFGELCFDTVIRANVKLREAARRGEPIGRFAKRANGAIDHAALAVEVLASAPFEWEAFEDVLDEGARQEDSLREVVVRYSDPGAGDVRIAGDFNGWVPDRDVDTRFEDDAGARVWTKVLHLAPGTYQYRYVVDGEWRPDPDNPRAIAGPVGGRSSLLIVR